MKAIQLIMLSSSLLMTFATFVGMFFNPLYYVFCPMAALLSYAIYKEKRW